jgi:type IV pilus assembly protein PilE
MKSSGHASRQHGVTLIELMIVVVIVGILAAIALPGYRQYVIRVTRTDAKKQLLTLAERLERCYTRTSDYRKIDDAGTPCITVGNVPEGTYSVAFGPGEPTASTFVLVATPIASQVGDAKCGNFTIDQAGTQGATGTLGATKCWQGRGS